MITKLLQPGDVVSCLRGSEIATLLVLRTSVVVLRCAPCADPVKKH
jgi:hypothetical protein